MQAGSRAPDFRHEHSVSTRLNHVAGLCEQFGFGDPQARGARLTLLELTDADHATARAFQARVIKPHLDAIIEGFYRLLVQQPGFLAVVGTDAMLAHLRETQRQYVLSLGLDFDSANYFEERLRIGIVHARVGVPLSLYQCAMRALQQQFFDHIDPAEPAAQRELLSAFILKITTLDMSLAIETYHGTHISALEKSIVSLRDRSQELQREAQIDAGTGLANRRHILETLETAIELAHREHTPLYLIMADLDWFKLINDSHGHLAGDKVLRAVADRIHGVIREFDKLGRYGGEEFLIVLANKQRDVIEKIAERILDAIKSTPIECGAGVEVHVTISLGIASLRPQDTVSSLIARSDAALYKAKNTGRDRIVFTPS